MNNFNDYEHVVIDGFGTLYDKNFIPLEGASRLLDVISDKGILFSNMGSISGLQLKDRLNGKFEFLPRKVITSLDILCRFLISENIKTIYHYGGKRADRTLRNITRIVNSIDKPVNALVFTSLPDDNWIKESQAILRYIYRHRDAKMILANPDRLLPGKHVGLNVGMMFDMLSQNWPRQEFNLSKIEIGKPLLKRSDLGLNHKEHVLVIGDNNFTDGGLAKALDADFILISEFAEMNTNHNWCYLSLEALLSDFDV
jgi:ribonucleotide monophosphatase NagD (HAD superfamily)